MRGRGVEVSKTLFYETDKYSRVKYPDILDCSGRTRIKQKYRMKEDKIEYFYPPKWGINDKIGKIYGNK